MSKPTFQFSTKYDTHLQTEFHELLEAFESLQADHESLLKLYQEAKNSNESGKKFLLEQSELIKTLTDTIKAYEQAQASWSEQQRTRASEEQQSMRLLEQSKQAITTQKTQIESLKNTLELLDNEHQHDLNAQQTKIEKHWQAKIDKKQAEIDDLQQQLATATKWQNIYKDEIKKEQTIKAQCLERIETLKAQNSTLTAQAKTLKNTIETRNEQTNKLSGLITKFKAMFNA